MRRALLIALFAVLACTVRLAAWGERGHQTVNRVAVRAIPDDGPSFLHAHEDWIVYLATIPDSWRASSEPFLKILEDPNHGWFREQFAFMKNADVPRSRYEFVLALDKEHRRLVAAGDQQAAARTNVRWTGTLPYAAVESYERMITGMRRYRAAREKGADTRLVELEIASYLGRLGHYIGDGAQPLHDTIHHDGWQGPNPKGYATDARIHGRFESRFVELMQLTADDVQKDVPAAVVLADPFDAVIAHLDDASQHVEQVYRLDKSGALADAANAEARALVRRQITRAAALLRDMAQTAWVRSGERMTFTPTDNPTLQTHPQYNPATGSAPAPRRTPKP
ncbi:MAG: nuclease [Vicinamibacteraceae bacterium]